MPDEFDELDHPWLIAAWPGMGSVATLAASHLVSALGAEIGRELPAGEFFEMQQVDVRHGLATPGRLPRQVALPWKNPDEAGRDLIIFIGEAQPTRDGLGLCRRIVDLARRWRVARVTTFAAMATQLSPDTDAGVLALATDTDVLDECRAAGLKLLEQGQVSGLNGLMLAAASEADIPGLCLMGEMPYFAVNIPNPPASLAVLEAFAELADLDLDLDSLRSDADRVRGQLQQLVERLSDSADQAREQELGFTTPDLDWSSGAADEPAEPEKSDEPALSPAARQRIEALFEEVQKDRSQAVKLKRELDRHGVFDEYEDRFLDLFRKGG